MLLILLVILYLFDFIGILALFGNQGIQPAGRDPATEFCQQLAGGGDLVADPGAAGGERVQQGLDAGLRRQGEAVARHHLRQTRERLLIDGGMAAVFQIDMLVQGGEGIGAKTALDGAR